jgi:hypothetical protein
MERQDVLGVLMKRWIGVDCRPGEWKREWLGGGGRAITEGEF